ncbi:MAG: HD domain-containing protein, partial [Candidatus Pacebacteria bacterium]|nr:HD domain-containing protein [Candidatus Paceibacterota bacterium]
QKNPQPPLPKPFEITTYRSESVYQDFRRPDKVEWGQNITDDLNRRDFTINAMAIKVPKKFFTSHWAKKSLLQPSYQLSAASYQLVDPHQGVKDLTNQLIKTVGQAEARFQEDALRMLRAIRFSVQLKMKLSKNIQQAIKNHHQLINHISQERISDELLKMLASNHPAQAIKLLDKTGLLQHIMPELQAAKGVEQGGHHTTDVWTHALDSLKHCPSPDPIVRLAALLHDIGKPQTYKVIDGRITFYNHEIVSSRIASKIAKRLKLTKKQTQRLFTLVRQHMFFYQPYHTDAAVRRLMRRAGLANIDDLLDLREGDRLGSGARKTSWRLEELKQRMIDQLHQPMAVTDLAIDGHDLIKELGLKPGPKIGQILNQLLEQVLEEPQLNNKKKLLAQAAKLK